MSETKHTPGEWRVLENVFPPTVGTSWTADGHENAQYVADVYEFTDCPDRRKSVEVAEAFANARLIAAAPDLLAALKRIIKDTECWYIDGGPCASTRRNVPCAHCQAEAAVQKAEGAF